MKGLIWKDLLNLKQQWKTYLLLIAVWIPIGYIIGVSSFIPVCMGILVIMSSNMAMAYDERDWNKYALTMPITRRDMVICKYILVLIITAVLFAVAAAFALFMKEGLKGLISMFVILSMVFIWLAVLLPLRFKFGTEHANLISRLILIIPVGIIAAMAGMVNHGWPGLLSVKNIAGWVILLFFASLAVFAFSAWVSVCILRKKDLQGQDKI